MKSAIITGAARGIGRGIVKRLAKESYALSLLDILEEELAAFKSELSKHYGNKFLAIGADISKSKEVDKAVRMHLKEFGKIDLLVNNAGILSKGSCEETTDDIWDNIIRVNLYGAFYLCRAVIPNMKKQGKGVIVNISSKAARSYTPFGGVSYASSKAGLLGLTRQLAHELAPFRIRANVICPGGTETPLARMNRAPEDLQKFIQGIPLGRMGKPEDIAAAVAFLASDEASYITGVTLDINGGTLII